MAFVNVLYLSCMIDNTNIELGIWIIRYVPYTDSYIIMSIVLNLMMCTLNLDLATNDWTIWLFFLVFMERKPVIFGEQIETKL